MIAYPAVNWIAVVVAGVATLALGALWYSPLLFGKPWLKAMGWSEAEMKDRQKAAVPGYVLALVGAIVNAYVLAVALVFFGAATLFDGVWVAGFLWAGLVAFSMATGTLFEGRPWSLFGVNAGNQLANQILIAAILILWP